ncbi:MAG: ArsA family ATPase [Thermoanaerobaculia bacterium]
MSLFDRIVQRQLILVMGKGGVGKSALAAVLAHSLAARGRRTLLLEVDPRENLHQLLDVAPSGGEIVEVGDGLHLQNLKPRRVVDWIVEKQLKIGLLVRRVLDSPIYHRFVEGAPGLLQLAILGHALRLVRGDLPRAPRIETVILDAPATGHGIYLLTAPRLVRDAVEHGPVASLAGEVADFVADGEKTGLCVVTQAEEMPVQEALELRQGLDEKIGRCPELLVVNALYPVPPGEDAGDDELTALWRRRRQVNDVELERLDREWDGPRVDLPLLAVDSGPELVRKLTEHFEDGLEDGLGGGGG